MSPGLSLRRGQNFSSSFPDGIGQWARPNDHGIATPTEHPTLDLAQAGEFHAQFHSAGFQFPELLRIVPFLFADVVGGMFIKADNDLLGSLAGMDAETIAQ